MAKHRKTSKETARRRVDDARAGAANSLVVLTTRQPRPAAKAKYEPRETGLERLQRAGKLSPLQLRAGNRYGRLWRDAQLQPGCFRSSTASLEAGPAGGAGGDKPPTDLLSTEDLVRIRRELAGAQMALGFAEDLVAVCDVICGKQWTLSQVSGVRRDQEALATLLWSATNTLAKHFAAGPGDGLRGPDSVGG